MLARTGMRVGELRALQADAVATVGEDPMAALSLLASWHTDRYIPLHPILVELLDQWRAWAGPDSTAGC